MCRFLFFLKQVYAEIIRRYTPNEQNNGSITLYAEWNTNTYIIEYDKNGGAGTMESSVHTHGIYKNLSANAFYKTGHDFIGWATSATGRVVYEDGESVVNLTSSNAEIVSLYAVWQAKTYNIVYENLLEDMTVYPKTYTYGEGLPELPLIYLRGTEVRVELETFYGWYTNRNFTARVYSISTTQTGDVTLYAKYDYFVTSTSSSSTYTVTDGNIANQPNFTVHMSLGAFRYEKIKHTTLDEIRIEISFDMWEINDGYQDLYLYCGSTEVWSVTIDRSSGKDTTPQHYNYIILLPLSQYKNEDLLNLQFAAHGTFGDDWQFNNFEMSVFFTN